MPRPGASTRIEDLKLLAVDVETTGLKPHRHQIVSIGWVPINGDVIDLSGAGYVVIRGSEGFSVGSSAVIHQLTDDEIAAGIDIKEALGQLLQALQGRAMLAHFHPSSAILFRPHASSISERFSTSPSWILLPWNAATWRGCPPTHVAKTSGLHAFDNDMVFPITPITRH